MLESIFSTAATITAAVSISELLICTAVSLGLGLIIAAVCWFTNRSCSKSLLTTLVLLPAIVQVVIMLVNGNLGVGVSVLGAFSLVRFRSVPGSGKEIASIFFAMAIGLATGTGYVAIAAIVTVILCAAMLLLHAFSFGGNDAASKMLKITIPENLDFTGVFDDIFEKYTSRAVLDRVKTTNMGSLYELTYTIVLKDVSQEKKFIDDLRCRNGNLTIICGKKDTSTMEL